MDFTTDEIRMLADVERKMDSGEMFYVVYRGERAAVNELVAEELGLERGPKPSSSSMYSISGLHRFKCCSRSAGRAAASIQ